MKPAAQTKGAEAPPRKAAAVREDVSAAVKDEVLEGVALVQKAIAISGKWPGRLRDDDGLPGGLIELPAEQRPIIVGDLHANLQNLKDILAHEDNQRDLDNGMATLIFVGDAMHDDRTGHMQETIGSMEVLDYLLRLILRYPRNLYYIRGNHDSFDHRLRKSGIAQGLEFKNALAAKYGMEYAEAIGLFFESLPIFIIAKGFVITHAGPPRGGLVREELVNIRHYPEKYHQLQWNRVNEYNGNPGPKEYGEKDIRLVLDQLELPPETAFIVGHNPLWNDGNKIGVWMDVIGIKNHHIIYSGSGSKAPYFTLVNGKLTCKLALIEKTEVYYYG